MKFLVFLIMFATCTFSAQTNKVAYLKDLLPLQASIEASSNLAVNAMEKGTDAEAEITAHKNAANPHMTTKWFSTSTNFLEWGNNEVREYIVDTKTYWHFEGELLDIGVPYPLSDYDANGFSIYETEAGSGLWDVQYTYADGLLTAEAIPSTSTWVNLVGTVPNVMVYGPITTTNLVSVKVFAIRDTLNGTNGIYFVDSESNTNYWLLFK